MFNPLLPRILYPEHLSFSFLVLSLLMGYHSYLPRTLGSAVREVSCGRFVIAFLSDVTAFAILGYLNIRGYNE